MNAIVSSDDNESKWLNNSKDECYRSNGLDMRQKTQPVASAKWKKVARKKKTRMALHDVSHSNVMEIPSCAETFLVGTASRPLNYASLSCASSPCPSSVKSTTVKHSKIRQGKKTSYRHIPHSEKPPHLVAKRNERERKRVQAVNSAFLRLRKYVPHEPRNKRLSKFKTLKFAIQYIQHMQDMIQSHDWQMASKRKTFSSRQNITTSSDCFISLSADQRTQNGNVLQDLPYSNLAPVDHLNDINEHQDRALRRLSRCNCNDDKNNVNLSGTNLNPENRSTRDVNSYQTSEYNRCVCFEQDYRLQRYHLEYRNFYQDFSYQIKNQPCIYQHCPLPEFEDNNIGVSADEQNVSYGLHSVQQLNDCRITDYSPFHQIPSASARVHSWEDCGSDISCSTSQESISPIDSIPSFHQVISLFDDGNFKEGHSNNIMARDCEYS